MFHKGDIVKGAGAGLNGHFLILDCNGRVDYTIVRLEDNWRTVLAAPVVEILMKKVA